MKYKLNYYKETDGKYRWDLDVGGVLFELYIPKWRVPKEVPETLSVEIEDINEGKSNPNIEPSINTEDDLVVLLFYDEEHAHTFRYTPDLNQDPNKWPIGQPYIPKSILPHRPDKIVMKVRWERKYND